jgi:hypothetical protein
MDDVLSDATLKKIDSIDGWLSPKEAQALYQFACLSLTKAKNKEILVEIGSWKGRSTSALAFACATYNKPVLHAIDPGDQIDPSEGMSRKTGPAQPTRVSLRKNLSRLGLSRFVHIVEKHSAEAWPAYTSARIRLLFVDGDHEYEAVWLDVTSWSRALVSQGYLLMHDCINHSGPRRVFLRLLRSSEYAYVTVVGDLAIFQKKRSLSLRNWLKKLYAMCVFGALFTLYKPAYS